MINEALGNKGIYMIDYPSSVSSNTTLLFLIYLSIQSS